MEESQKRFGLFSKIGQLAEQDNYIGATGIGIAARFTHIKRYRDAAIHGRTTVNRQLLTSNQS